MGAAERVDVVGAAQVHRGDDRGYGLAAARRGERSDAADAGDARRDDAHVRRRDHRVAAARDVRADGADRDVAVPQPDSGERLDLDVRQARALRLGEASHLSLSEADVVQRLVVDGGQAALDGVVAQAEVAALPAIQARGELAQCAIAALAHGGDDLRDGGGNGLLVVCGRCRHDYVFIRTRSLPVQRTLPPRATGKITSRDIAAEAGVSQSTVSRVLRRDARVHPAKAARVRAAAERHGYAPSAAARALITQRSDTVAVVVDDLTNPFYPELVERLRTALEQRGYMSTLLNEATDAGSDTLAALLAGGGADGAIFLAATTGGATTALLAGAALPTVLLNRDVPGARTDRVLVDNASGARLVAEHLVALGHRRLAMVAGPSATSTSAQRERAFTAAAGDVAVHRADDYSYAAGRRIGIELLAGRQPPTAIFCANDILAFGVVDAARARGVDVPRELSIAGFDDVAMAAWNAFDLTTVRQPLGAMADAAAQLLAGRIESPGGRSRRNVHPAELVVRSSTGRVRGRR